MRRLQQSEKLQCPALCLPSLYQAMLDCWRLDARLRISAVDLRHVVMGVVTASELTDTALDSLDWPAIESQSRQTVSSSISFDLQSESTVAAFKAPEISPSQITLGSLLGQGQFGAVYRATMKGKDGASTSVAVKQMLETGVSDVERGQFEYEARLLAAIKHVNIVTLKAVCFQSQPSFIVLELMSMDLKSYLHVKRI